MVRFYSPHYSRCVWVCLLLLVISTASCTWGLFTAALHVSPESHHGKDFLRSASCSCHSTCLNASARPHLLQNHRRFSKARTRRCTRGVPAQAWILFQSRQYVPHTSSAPQQRQFSLKWLKILNKCLDRTQEQLVLKRYPALLTSRAPALDWSSFKRSLVSVTRRGHLPGRTSSKSSPSSDRILPPRYSGTSVRATLRKADLFTNVRVSPSAALEGSKQVVSENYPSKKEVCTQLATGCGCKKKTNYIHAREGKRWVPFELDSRNCTQHTPRSSCSVHGRVKGAENQRDGTAATQVFRSLGEWRRDGGRDRATWTRKDSFPFQRHKRVQLRTCSAVLPTCKFLGNISDVLLPVSSRLRSTSHVVKTWIIKWITGVEAAGCERLARQEATQGNRNEHPLGTQRWRFVLQGRRWLGFRARDEEETVDIDFFTDGTAVTEHGITGVWTTTRVGLSLFLFVPCPAETTSPLEEPTPPKRGATPGETQLQHSVSHVCETTAEVPYDVMHLTAHFYWNPENRTPYMYRGSVTKDRRAGFLPSFILRPVVATFYGYGIDDTPENCSQTR